MENISDIKQYSPLALAFLGDAVYELYTRQLILAQGNCSVNQMHRKTVEIVNAKAQSDAFSRLEAVLTEEELAIYKRGRNANSQSSPKHADIADYRRATGVEALFGYLFLKGDLQRVAEIFAIAAESAAQNKVEGV